jgi:uncharacterized phage protein (TIGR01671 family)
MNRELKFRVWNGMEMVYDVIAGKFGTFYVNPYNNGIDEKDSACLTPNNTKYENHIPVMQFTGLKDKNDKEIYEGDILKGRYFGKKCFWIIQKGNHRDNENVYFTMWPYVISDPYRMEYNGFRIESKGETTFEYIVGSIYENPDILNGLE